MNSSDVGLLPMATPIWTNGKIAKKDFSVAALIGMAQNKVIIRKIPLMQPAAQIKE